MKKYYDDRHHLNMEISDAEDGIMHIKLHQPTGITEIVVTEAEGKEIIELNTTTTTVKLAATCR